MADANVQPIRITQQQTIFRFSIPQEVRVTYADLAKDYVPDEWRPIGEFDEIASENDPNIFTWTEGIDFYEDPIFRGLPSEVEYLKFRFKSFDIVRGRLREEVTGNLIPEAAVPTYNPNVIAFTFNDKYQISDLGFFTDTNGNAAGNPYRYEALMAPSEWYFMNEEDSDFQWSLKMDIFNENVPTGVLTNLQLFHTQRLIRFSYELEIEYKIRNVNPSQEIEEQEVTMVNLYKMVEEFFPRRKKDKDKKKRDGISSGMASAISKSRQLGVPGQPLPKEEADFFIEKLLSFLTTQRKGDDE